LPVFLLLLSGCSGDKPTEPANISGQPNKTCQYCQASFSVSGYARTHTENNQIQYKLTAGELSKRPRNGRIVKFVSYDELSFQRLTIEQVLHGDIVKFDDMYDVVLITPAKDTPHSAQADGEMVLGNRLNRLLADDVRLTFLPPDRSAIVLTADHAKMLTDTMVIRFDGNVRISAKKCKIAADSAIWSSVESGLLLSSDYQYNSKTYEKPAFFQITSAGRCLRTKTTPQVEYVDQLDLLEDKLLETMPVSARLMFGLLMAPDAAGAADKQTLIHIQ